MSTEYFTKQQHNIHSSQQPIEHLPRRLYLKKQRKLHKIQENRNKPCIISDHNAIKLELNKKTIAENTQIIGG
jgi:hypothetical protein